VLAAGLLDEVLAAGLLDEELAAGLLDEVLAAGLADAVMLKNKDNFAKQVNGVYIAETTMNILIIWKFECNTFYHQPVPTS